MSEININRLIGEFTGTLEGIMAWEIPSELKEKLQKKVDQLKAMPIHFPTDSGINADKIIDWNKLRDKFFDECTGQVEFHRPKVDMTPNDLFNWIVKQFSHQQPKPLSLDEIKHMAHCYSISEWGLSNKTIIPGSKDESRYKITKEDFINGAIWYKQQLSHQQPKPALNESDVSGSVCELDEWDGGDETNLCDCGKGEGCCKRKQTLH